MHANPMTREDALAYLHGETFKLQPPDYGELYPKWPGAIGIEVEMLPVQGLANQPGQAVPLRGPDSLSFHLEALALAQGWQVETAEGIAGERLLTRIDLPTGNLTFEPGGQLEFSSRPYPCLSDVVRHLRHVQAIVDDWLAPRGIHLIQVGINPWHTLDAIGLQMPKPRYLAMDEYYQRVGPYGRRMMRQTCTVQVNLDFGPDTQAMVKRYLAAQLLAPVATATFANSPVVDGQKAGVPGFRSRVWRHTDPTHTGVIGLAAIAQQMSRQVCIETYLEAVLAATVVFIDRDPVRIPPRGLRFQDWMLEGYEGTYPTLADFKTHLSLMFTEVRPRGFLELRSVDCQSRAWQDIPSYYYTGLLYRDEIVDQVLDLMLPRLGDIDRLLGVAEQGLGHAELAELAAKVMNLACQGFGALPSCFLEDQSQLKMQKFADRFTMRGMTPADEILAIMERDGGTLTLNSYQALEAAWTEHLDR